jgi:hypothetical protein
VVVIQKYISKKIENGLLPFICATAKTAKTPTPPNGMFLILAEVVRGCYISPTIFSGSDTFWHLLAAESDTCLGTISSVNHTTIASDM